MEENHTIIEYEVDTSKLLHHLQTNTEKCATDVARAHGDRSTEAAGPALDVTTLGNDGQLILVVGNDFSKLLLDESRVDILSTNIGKSLHGLLNLALLDEVTWGFWEEKESNTENDSPEKLDSNWNTV